jgi:hypothetical protein
VRYRHARRSPTRLTSKLVCASVPSQDPRARSTRPPEGTQLRATEVDPPQLGATEILTEEVSHNPAVASPTGDPLAPGRSDAAAIDQDLYA